MIESTINGLPSSVLFGLEMAAENDLDSRPSHHDDSEDHEHDDFESFVITLPEQDDVHDFMKKIENATNIIGALRVKGFAAIKSKPLRLVVQGVGPRFESYFDRPFVEDEKRQTHMVFIGPKGMKRDRVKAILQK